MPTLWVRFGDTRDYPLVIEPGGIRRAGSWAAKRVAGRTAFIITHPRIDKLYGAAVRRSLKGAGFSVHMHCVPEGESTKSLAYLERITGAMLKLRLDRRSVVIALGGGVVGDLAGFVAATYMRGVDFIQIPTTLLAQVDSSVGGKVAVNHALGKNMMGAFYQPRLVLIDPQVLKTLARRQFRAGLAEVIKAGAIADAAFFGFLEKHMQEILQLKQDILTRIIHRACAIKAAVVSKDEKEKGLRAILNYGHTIGHALEAYHHYKKYLHGEAVAIGMMGAAQLSTGGFVSSGAPVEKMKNILIRAGLPIHGQGESPEKVIELMKVDKKAREGKLNFVLTPKIGHARISNKLTPFSVRRAIIAIIC